MLLAETRRVTHGNTWNFIVSFHYSKLLKNKEVCLSGLISA